MRDSRKPAHRRLRARPASLRPGLVLLMFALCLVAAAGAGAQSGRRKPPPLSPVPTPSPTPEGEGESESQPRPKREKGAEVSFEVYESDSAFPYFDYRVEELVVGSFTERLSRNTSLSAARGSGKLSRKQAQDIAKKETEAFVILLELTDEANEVGRGGAGQGDTRGLVIKTYVYEPVTGTLKFMNSTYQRPYHPTTSVGGVRLPIPVPGTRIERFPYELQLEQAAQDAADRIMLRFHLRLPPDN